MRLFSEVGKVALLFLFLAFVLAFTGCASKIPKSYPLPEAEKDLAYEKFKEFQSQQCDSYLDADVSVEWQGYGKTEKIPGMLQMQAPSFLRFSIVDPLGRQLLILTSNGETFTLVNNHKAEALTGSVRSTFWQKFVPAYIPPYDYFSWVVAELPATGINIQDIRKDENPENIWFISSWDEKARHRILFDPDMEAISRHILEDREGDVLVDFFYSGYKTGQNTCTRPGQIHVEGAEISGKLTFRFDSYFTESTTSFDMFHLIIPDHYSIEIAH